MHMKLFVSNTLFLLLTSVQENKIMRLLQCAFLYVHAFCFFFKLHLTIYSFITNPVLRHSPYTLCPCLHIGGELCHI